MVSYPSAPIALAGGNGMDGDVNLYGVRQTSLVRGGHLELMAVLLNGITLNWLSRH